MSHVKESITVVTEAKSSLSELAAPVAVWSLQPDTRKCPEQLGSHAAALQRMACLLPIPYSRLPGWGKVLSAVIEKPEWPSPGNLTHSQRKHCRVLTVLMKSLHKTSLHNRIQQYLPVFSDA